MPIYNVYCLNCKNSYGLTATPSDIYEMDTDYGVRSFLSCVMCNGNAKVQGQATNMHVGRSWEDKMNDQRAEYFNSAVQPYRNGELSKEFVEAYPDKVKQMVKEGVVTPDEVKKSKEVWKDLPGHKDRKKSK